jgi:peptidoglycan/LPS O-acetylase OafA/YrhL
MIWEALGSALIGLAVAYVGSRRLPERLPSPRLVLATGAVASLAGGLLTHTVLGDGHPLTTLVGALAVGVALLSLLVRPSGPRRRSPAVRPADG